MAKLREIYKCTLCGNIVEILHEGDGEIVCCGQPMQLVKENTVDASKEKHYIEWIQIIADNIAYRKFLKPGDKPEAEFVVTAEKISAREFCNLHGLWKT